MEKKFNEGSTTWTSDRIMRHERLEMLGIHVLLSNQQSTGWRLALLAKQMQDNSHRAQENCSINEI